MEHDVRLIDADLRSLDGRVASAVRRHADGCAVTRFTLWYTARPPVHVAIVTSAAAREAA
jgi:hypothetical protein